MRKCFIYITMVLAAGACASKKDATDPCLLIECPAMNQTVRFRMVDRATGKDYFFSNPPLYPVSELRVMVDGTDSGYVYADSVHQYISTFFPGAGEHILRITLPGVISDSIQFDMKYTQINCCLSLGTYISVSINDTLVGNNLSDSTILVIRK